MKIAIGNDHAATELKFVIMDYLKELGHEVINFGTDGTDSCNYPEYGEKVGRAVVAGEADCGVLIAEPVWESPSQPIKSTVCVQQCAPTRQLRGW